MRLAHTRGILNTVTPRFRATQRRQCTRANCGRTVLVNKDGSLRAHRVPLGKTRYLGQMCRDPKTGKAHTPLAANQTSDLPTPAHSPSAAFITLRVKQTLHTAQPDDTKDPTTTASQDPRTNRHGATSTHHMTPIEEQFHTGRRKMINAFADLTTLATRAGAHHDSITALHGQFFDGNVDVKDAWTTSAFTTWLRDPQPKGQT